jgi:lipoate-protein ligase A
LHTDELTYAVIAPLDEPRVYGGVLESYARLAQALLAALQRLGLPARAEKENPLPEGAQAGGPVCFEVPSTYEITAGGKKLIGSAQARRKEGVLQHGSLPLYGDLARITRGLAFPDEPARARAAERLLAHATNIEMLGLHVSWDGAAEAFCDAFAEILHLALQEQPLTPEELHRAETLMAEKYAHPSWTERV